MISAFTGKKKVMVLAGNPKLFRSIRSALIEKGFENLFHPEPLQNYDLMLVDSAFADPAFLVFIKRSRLSDFPIVLVRHEYENQSLIRNNEEAFYDEIVISSTDEFEQATAKISRWLSAPETLGLFHDSLPEFGRGLWMWMIDQVKKMPKEFNYGNSFSQI